MSRDEQHQADIFVDVVSGERPDRRSPQSVALDRRDVALARRLRDVADDMGPDPSFVDDLEQQLLRSNGYDDRRNGHRQLSLRTYTRWLGAWSRHLFRWGRTRYVTALVLLLGIIVVVPILAQIGLEQFAPRDAEAAPTPKQVTYAPVPAEAQTTTVDALAQQAGFALQIPATLPPGCSWQDGRYLAQSQHVSLEYSCVSIAQASADTVQRPYVGEESAQEVLVNGVPAVYIDGVWREVGDERIWWEHGPKQLILEQDGLVVRLTGTSKSITREDLVAIAESLVTSTSSQ